MSNQLYSTLDDTNFDLIRISLDYNNMVASFGISIWILILLVALSVLIWGGSFRRKNFRIVKLTIPLGNIGEVELAPNLQDIQIAHKIWTELITRKAALPIDPENDVLIEVYDSWYALFTKVRELISEVPAELVRKEKSTQELVRISTATLNDGLRPHLTKWQARFRHWYQLNSDELKDLPPQELQRKYPEYDELISDMIKINEDLILYAKELKKIVDGEI